uniref:Glycosyltransferase family 1 protein n=1 Tax=Desulfobacca acetoxidans TaxID=60893 RepID=A0A7V6DP88_9BACT
MEGYMAEPIFASDLQCSDCMGTLSELALDLRWSWDRSADEIWRPLCPELWDLTRNPWVILQTISPARLKELVADDTFIKNVQNLAEKMHISRTEAAWFQETQANAPVTTVAYFSMEFMLGEALPIYSGGLGNVAGDQLKAASDLGVPVIGVGLLYQEGYFRQAIAADGSQLALFPINDPGQLPIKPLRDASGEWVRLQLRMPAYKVWVRAWEVQVGRVKLYLLDMNDPGNPPIMRSITNELYGGGVEMRIAQEAVLGIAGWRLLRTMGLNPEVCHLNEGHAAFAILERAADFMKTTGQPFDVALQVTRAGNLFTTHTPVEAGFDRFSPNLMRQYLAEYAQTQLDLSFRDFMALGRWNPDDDQEPFNMAYLAMRGSGAVNGVSQLHGKVSRKIFQPLFPRWPQSEVPIGSVTNGIHVPTWDSRPSDALWTRHCGKARWRGETEQMVETIRNVSDEELWQMRQDCRRILVEYARLRYARQLAESGASGEEITQAGQILDPEVLTLGFARRFATYKRPTLMLHDPERLARMLTNPQRPVQMLIAGKAHPADGAGQDMIRQWVLFTRRPDVKGKVIFLSDYDMLLTEQLVNGVDVWINTPRRPWEACGTSGMKVLANGGLNLSELDGWWAEAFDPRLGWALGDGHEHGDDPAWDAAEAESLYSLLENEVIPTFYDRRNNGRPDAWLAKVRQSMTTLTVKFSANRAVQQYTTEFYVPAAQAYQARLAKKCALGISLVQQRQTLERQWSSLSFGDLQVETHDGQHQFRIGVNFGSVDPGAVQVELFALNADGQPFRQTMVQGGKLPGIEGEYVYTAQVPASRPVGDFTPRIIPKIDGMKVPLELPLILWQH